MNFYPCCLPCCYPCCDLFLAGQRAFDLWYTPGKVGAVKTGNARYANLRNDLPFVAEKKLQPSALKPDSALAPAHECISGRTKAGSFRKFQMSNQSIASQMGFREC